MILLSIFFTLSISANILMVWYSKKLLNKFTDITDGIGIFNSKIKGLSDHLASVHQLEMFYGEPVLQRLIQHMKLTVIEIKMFSDSFIISEGEEKEEPVNDQEKAE